MTDHRPTGRSLITRRAFVDIIRPAVAGSYGVTGFVRGTPMERLRRRLGLSEPGIRVSMRDGLSIDLYLTVAYGLPIAEVARQADSAVRYALRRATAREVDRLTIHVGGMRYQPAAAVPPAEPPALPAGDARPDRAVADALAVAEALAAAEAAATVDGDVAG
jgi:uncharacterized alkaline shock family protein YloU